MQLLKIIKSRFLDKILTLDKSIVHYCVNTNSFSLFKLRDNYTDVNIFDFIISNNYSSRVLSIYDSQEQCSDILTTLLRNSIFSKAPFPYDYHRVIFISFVDIMFFAYTVFDLDGKLMTINYLFNTKISSNILNLIDFNIRKNHNLFFKEDLESLNNLLKLDSLNEDSFLDYYQYKSDHKVFIPCYSNFDVDIKNNFKFKMRDWCADYGLITLGRTGCMFLEIERLIANEVILKFKT